MSLVVEDGTGLANAESFIGVTDADARHTNLGNTAWTDVSVTTAAKEAALRKATNYMEQAYRQRWQGFPRKPRTAYPSQPVVIPQALSWPRWDVWVDGYPVDTQSIPAEVKNACADLALKALIYTDLNADLTTRVLTKKVGPLEKTYDRFSPQQTRYPAIDMVLSPYLMSGSASARLVRA